MRPKITQQFSNLRRKLSTVADEEWEGIMRSWEWWSIGRGEKGFEGEGEGEREQDKVRILNVCIYFFSAVQNNLSSVILAPQPTLTVTPEPLTANQESQGCINSLDFALLLGHPTVHPDIPPPTPTIKLPEPVPELRSCSFRHPFCPNVLPFRHTHRWLFSCLSCSKADGR